MPYYRCPSCGVTSFTAAGHSTVGLCPECATPLGSGPRGGLRLVIVDAPSDEGAHSGLPPQATADAVALEMECGT
jgi:hypothetical protein